MNSSTGFKKRALLRPVSGVRRQQKEFLRTFDLSQSESLLSNQVKNALSQMQDSINELDKDKKIRTGDSTLEKSYVVTLRKWLRQSMNSASLEKESDDFRIMKFMGVENYEAGFRKLWKTATMLDQVICKVNELEIVQMLRYDQAHEILCSQTSPKSSEFLSNLGNTGGYTPSSFGIAQVLLERNRDLYEVAMERKKDKSDSNGSFVTSVNNKQSLGSTTMSKNETNELIKELQKENAKLVQLMEDLEKQKQATENQVQQLKAEEQRLSSEKENKRPQQSTTPKDTAPKEQNFFSELQEKYKERINSMQAEIGQLESQVTQLKGSLGTAEAKLKMALQDVDSFKAERGLKPKSGSYEEALMEEMEKMKKGFEKKIATLLDGFNTKQKDMRRKEIELKSENDKVKWEKSLLLKKFDALQQNK